jgi:hypothetical protein
VAYCSAMTSHVLVVGDSLTYHGPDRPHVLTDGRLWPNVASAEFGDDVDVDLVARLGWTARDAWWAVTKDPYLWGAVLPRADALVLAVGGMDHLPASVPTYLRDGIPYLRPAALRRRVRQAYRSLSPPVIRLTDGRLRQLPQEATDHYLARITAAARVFNPDIPVVLVAPGIHNSPDYPSDRHHEPALVAARQWVTRNGTGLVETDALCLPSLQDGSANPDGIHYSWQTHQLIGDAVAAELRVVGFNPAAGSLALSGE